MKYILFIIIVYVALNGGFTAFACTKHFSSIVSRDTRKIAGIVQIVTSILLAIVTNTLFPDRNTTFWILFAMIVFLMLCGFINLLIWICSDL